METDTEHAEFPPASADEPPAKAAARWQKAQPPRFTPSTSADAALATIVLLGVEHMRGNEACVMARDHVEGVHQLRVAVRRLRSCLSLFKAYIPPPQSSHLNGELKWLIGQLGPARDWDVFVDDILRPVRKQIPDEARLDELAQRVDEHRDAAYAHAQRGIGDHRYLGLVMLLDAWADGRRWREYLPASVAAAMQRPVIQLANQMLHEHYESVTAAGEGFVDLVPEDRHSLRIQIKKLRYASEFFASLYPKRKVVPFMAMLKELQDDLGAGNDIEVARTLLRKVTRPLGGREKTRLSYAAGLVVGWHSHVTGVREARLVTAWEQFVARPPFWQVPTPPVEAEATPPEATAATDEVALEDAGAPAPNAAIDGHGLDALTGAADAPRVPVASVSTSS
jgi:Uncharacterized conserved protein